MVENEFEDNSSGIQQNTKQQPMQNESCVEPQILLTNDTIVQLRHQASSASSFAVKLVKQMFEASELIGRNISGVRGKKQLDIAKVNKIKEIVHQFYPVPAAEALETWRNCRKAIDSFLRKTYKTVTKDELTDA